MAAVFGPPFSFHQRLTGMSHIGDSRKLDGLRSNVLNAPVSGLHDTAARVETVVLHPVHELSGFPSTSRLASPA